MIWRAARTCSALLVASLPGPDQSEVLEPDADVAAHRGGHRGDGELIAAGAEHRPSVLLAEQTVGGALHMHDVLGMRADPAQDAEHGLDEQRRLDEAALEEVTEIVEMGGVVALELEARPGIAKRAQHEFDVLDRCCGTRDRASSRAPAAPNRA